MYFFLSLTLILGVVSALLGDLLSWFVGVWSYWREKGQLLHHLVLLLVPLCQLLAPTGPVPQPDAQSLPQDLRGSSLFLRHGGQPWERGSESAEKGRRENHSYELQRWGQKSVGGGFLFIHVFPLKCNNFVFFRLLLLLADLCDRKTKQV